MRDNGEMQPLIDHLDSMTEFNPSQLRDDNPERQQFNEKVRKRRPERRQRGVYEKLPGSGVWWIRYSDATGRIRREKGGTKSSAILLYRKRKQEVLEGKKLPEKLRVPSVSFAEIAKDALDYSKAHKRTYDNDLYRMQRLLGWFRDRAADSITPQDIERRFAEAVEQDGWKPATVNRVRALFSLIYRLAIQNGKVKENPARLVKHRTENNGRTRYLTSEEEGKLRAVIATRWPRHMPEFDLALYTGLRLSEQDGLTWENVNLSRRLLTVPRSKNGETRHVPLNTGALCALETLRVEQATPSGPVFRQANGDPLTGPRKWFEPAVRLARVRDFSWHCLRHTFASRLVMAGVDLRTIQELGGWKILGMVARYAHLAPQHLLAAVERLVPTSASCPISSEPTGTRTSTEAIALPEREPAVVQ
jgi:site-specific recombinase XerD